MIVELILSKSVKIKGKKHFFFAFVGDYYTFFFTNAY